ncbi:3-deoxy-D-manno-octulosonate 8-phosphate phosphatase (KDO 8-P phosphatase) [Filimonas lacunae]|uniref:3-deoxy-D-manno-octulosonate 8-phosphate phosphatase (KDO 8-P phosphatase) n=1 Tax=Filimonas lacunae TaxID=477680 RepID=A0A173ME25_9BACT|nr:HAD family hydrolase [Filimonas lacunae]BAV05746.1 3-deoxy-D-manno-octulosonate 8-phosphate phosphatase [Filimonas lacunae]SIT28731.1 3-deoxy-D-manno-octulosonate 8-phosphate phosphatase (KDO 8-P phosphatase) [Filimonas lacunae]
MNVLELFKPITTFVFDVDGVLTDGMLLVMPGGLMARRMNIKDGYALQLAIKRGYKVVIISGGNSPEVKERLNNLGITDVFMKVENKLECLQQYMQQHQLKAEELLFMGDDIPDYEVMQLTALPCCPSDAVAEIRSIARYISPLKGGEGCGRDVIEKVLKLRGDWMTDTQIKSQ